MVGYLLEVDLKHPDELHVLHNDCPLAPENLLFQVICCRNIVNQIADKSEIKVGDVKKINSKFR